MLSLYVLFSDTYHLFTQVHACAALYVIPALSATVSLFACSGRSIYVFSEWAIVSDKGHIVVYFQQIDRMNLLIILLGLLDVYYSVNGKFETYFFGSVGKDFVYHA